MFFNEIYGAYYNAVSKILAKAVEKTVTPKDIRKIVEEAAFGESSINIENSLSGEKWQLVTKNGDTPLENKPSLPLTTLEKRWLKAISLDPKVKLFGEDFSDLRDVEPLFTPDDICVFDKYADGDPYEDEKYINNFRLMLDAINRQYPVKLTTKNNKGEEKYIVFLPQYMEYSEKDDKFRVVGSGGRWATVVNMGRIIWCHPYVKPYTPNTNTKMVRDKETVIFQLTDERNALERALMHFAHFEKQAEKLADNQYRITVTYDKDDETELLIRVLSFGPMIKVTSPDSFINLIKERLIKQKSCGQ